LFIELLLSFSTKIGSSSIILEVDFKARLLSKPSPIFYIFLTTSSQKVFLPSILKKVVNKALFYDFFI